MYQEIGTVPDNFLSQQTLSEIIMVMCDDDGGEGKGGRRGRKNKATFSDDSTLTTE